MLDLLPQRLQHLRQQQGLDEEPEAETTYMAQYAGVKARESPVSSSVSNKFLFLVSEHAKTITGTII